ncbi:MAG: tetratricopeptide repeat protein, partial [candidate division WOR-3 bacterium]
MNNDLKRIKERLERDPNSLLFAQYADLLRREGKIEEAIKVAEEGVQKHPEYATGFLVLGRCYNKKGEMERAVQYIKSGDKESAKRTLKKQLELDPLDREAKKLLREIDEEKEEDSVGSLSSFFEEELGKEEGGFEEEFSEFESDLAEEEVLDEEEFSPEEEEEDFDSGEVTEEIDIQSLSSEEFEEGEEKDEREEEVSLGEKETFGVDERDVEGKEEVSLEDEEWEELDEKVKDEDWVEEEIGEDWLEDEKEEKIEERIEEKSEAIEDELEEEFAGGSAGEESEGFELKDEVEEEL